MLVEEFEKIKKSQSHHQVTQRAIALRENILKKVAAEVNNVGKFAEKEENALISKSLDICADLLVELRNISLIVAESIYHWKQQLINLRNLSTALPPKPLSPPVFYHQDRVSYLLKLRSDTRYLYASALARFIPQSSKCDPFFIYCHKVFKHEQSQPSPHASKVAAIEKPVLFRIKNCERFIAEEVHYYQSMQVLPRNIDAAEAQHTKAEANSSANNAEQAHKITHPEPNSTQEDTQLRKRSYTQEVKSLKEQKKSGAHKIETQKESRSEMKPGSFSLAKE